jgi:hypothetical protein
MDPTSKRILTTAREAIERGERVLTRQRQVIARRMVAGQGGAPAVHLLLDFEATQLRHVAAYKALLLRFEQANHETGTSGPDIMEGNPSHR